MADKPDTDKLLTTVAPSPKMQVGINYPYWSDKEGLFLGSNLAQEPWEADLEKTITDYEALRVKIFRIFALANLADYGTVSPVTKAFTPPKSVPFKYVDGLKRLLSIVKKTNARVILSAVNYDAFNLASLQAGATDRWPIAADPTLRNKFFDDVLETLLIESKPFSEHIIAWEVMNEPLWSVADFSENPNNQFGAVLPRTNVEEFIKQGLALIEKHGFASTVGHANLKELDDYPNGTLRQFHFYPNHSRGDHVHGFATTNAFVGEFASALAEEDPFTILDRQQAHLRPWPELATRDCLDERTTMFERLKLLNKRGYKMAFIWPNHDGNIDGSSKLSLAAKNGIADYNALP